VSGESAVGDLNVDDDNTATSVSGAVGSSALANQRSTMDLLWKFECPESKGRSVTAMAWNHANPDLLAVAYGDFQFKKDQKGGAILFWTLKNPEFPEEIVYTESGVCSIDFSTTHPSLLAAGMSDGNVAIYDLRDSGSGGVLAMTGMKGGANANDTKGAGAGGKGGDSRDGSGAAKGNGAGASSASAAGAVGVDDVTAELLAGGAAGICEGNTGNGAAGAHTSLQPVLESAKLAAADQHTDAVWQVRWVSRKDSIHGRSNEVLVSISLDGRVTEWSLRKGLTATDLMVLKRVNSSARGGLPTGEGIISRTAAGLCFDFPSDDSTVYLAGTEDGTIHKCSCSYNEQYLESYFGHAGPVNKVHCSPFVPHIFLSCSADWTMKLWDAHKADKEILTFQAVDLSDVVHDVCWSPNISTLFGSVTGDGRLEVWDLARSTLDPVMTWKRSEHVTDEHGNSSTHDATPPSDHPADELDSVSGGGTGKYSSGTSSENRDLRAGSKKAKAQQAEASIAAHYCAIGFARNAPVLVAGDSNGSVDVFRLTGHESSLPSAGANLPAHGFQSPIVDDDIDSASAGPSVAAQQATRLLDAICQDKAMT
jgi:WD40 repeat protein